MFTEQCWEMGNSPWRPAVDMGAVWHRLSLPLDGHRLVRAHWALLEFSLELLMASPGWVTSAHWVPCDTCLCHSGFGHLNSSPHASWWRAAEITNHLFWTDFSWCLGLTDPGSTADPKLQPPCMRYKRPRPLHALQEASTSPAHLTGDLSPLCNLGETLKTPLRVPFADQAVHP